MDKNRPFTIWLTGMPCSGKTTIAEALIKKLENYKSLDLCKEKNPLEYYKLISLDGDDLRGKLNRDLSFSTADRKENLRRVGHIAQLFNEKGICVVCSFVSPTEELRDEAISKIENVVLIHVECSAETCAKRDVKGMWAKAKLGEIKMFTGFNSPYDNPEHPDIVLNTEEKTIEECVETIFDYFKLIAN